MPQISAAYMSMPQISAANTSRPMPQISATNTSMTRVSFFENGRNQIITSYIELRLSCLHFFLGLPKCESNIILF